MARFCGRCADALALTRLRLALAFELDLLTLAVLAVLHGARLVRLTRPNFSAAI